MLRGLRLDNVQLQLLGIRRTHVGHERPSPSGETRLGHRLFRESSIDFGADGARTMMLVYSLPQTGAIFNRNAATSPKLGPAASGASTDRLICSRARQRQRQRPRQNTAAGMA